MITLCVLGWSSPTFASTPLRTNGINLDEKMPEKYQMVLMLTYVHFNIVPATEEPNNAFIAGLGGRMKICNGMALIGEYHYP